MKMKPIISYEMYQKYLNKIIYSLNIEVLCFVILGVGIYQYVSLWQVGALYMFFESEMLATYFFRVTLIWALFYFGKKIVITRKIDMLYNQDNVEEDDWYLPCIVNTKIYNSHFGYIFADNAVLWVQENRVSDEPVKFKGRIEEIRVLVEIDKKNFWAGVLWGDKEILVLEDMNRGKRIELLVPNPQGIQRAMLENIKTKG